MNKLIELVKNIGKTQVNERKMRSIQQDAYIRTIHSAAPFVF